MDDVNTERSSTRAVTPGWLRDFARFCQERGGNPVRVTIAAVNRWAPAEREWLGARWCKTQKEIETRKATLRMTEIETQLINARLHALRKERVTKLQERLADLQQWHRDAGPRRSS